MATDNREKHLMSRRTFISGSASMTAGLFLMGTAGCSPSQPSGSKAVMAPKASNTYTYQACPRNCHDTCTLISEVEDNRIISITGDPKNPITAGTPCVKGHNYLAWQYHPDRILYPMKRAGKKGAGKWERITWDEAYNTIAQKFNEITAEHGSEAILPYSYSGNLGIVNNYGYPFRFWNKLGASNLERAVCSDAGKAATKYAYGQTAGIDPETYARTKLFVSWGINHAATNIHAIKFINQARVRELSWLRLTP
jgi:anaerobic selenocysteine-containing dehydrogenase